MEDDVGHYQFFVQRGTFTMLEQVHGLSPVHTGLARKQNHAFAMTQQNTPRFGTFVCRRVPR